MEVTREVDVPATKQTRITHYVCDLCGGTSHNGLAINWHGEPGKVDHVRVEREVGFSGGGTGMTDRMEFDVCPSCWESKLLPFMESHGARPRKTEVSW